MDPTGQRVWRLLFEAVQVRALCNVENRFGSIQSCNMLTTMIKEISLSLSLQSLYYQSLKENCHIWGYLRLIDVICDLQTHV